METFPNNGGLPSAFNGDNVPTQQSDMWRPWTGEDKPDAHKIYSEHGDLSDPKSSKPPQFVHPVKLYWPKSRCFDYMFQDAEMLLRNYPVQATICVYEDSSSDEDSDDEEEEMEKELN
ncbi:protein ripply2-like [Hippoglossus hippoglossus]|uniref:protein ripply2-like n=1 Tax=Hippoglossus hippoglossus TaxID=8267 RepID=UPI00148E3F0B|nr:protein ripply2-like [Hippoglossus hippoglossus]XP_035000238.1 protein ripply2 [Hippoglossus stenolepis]